MIDRQRLSRSPLRRVILPVLSRLNPGDVTLRNPHTRDPLRLHSFKHRGYWFHGKRRESENMGVFRECVAPGGGVIEVGAHIGFVTQFLAQLVGPDGAVVAYEPGPNNLPYLRRNTASLPAVTVVEAGVGSEEGEATFYVEELTGQNNSLVPDFAGLASNERSAGVSGGAHAVVIPVTTLDANIPAGRVDLVKIDVEGFELEVIRGGRGLLDEKSPVLMVEVQRDLDELTRVADDLGYDTYDHRVRPVRIADIPGGAGDTFWFKRGVHDDLVGRLQARSG